MDEMTRLLLEDLISDTPYVSPAATVTVKRGDMVEVLGPWSNGHTEQIAIVTHVYGTGLPGDRVNLHVFVDEGDTLIASRVSFYPTRKEAEQATQALPEFTDIVGAPSACYPLE
jgi:hypothetical protein